MKRFAVLLTVFNRVELTKKCLYKLKNAIEFVSDASFDIILTDDGSTDNTSDIIGSLFPNVKILKGNGELFWCRGMINSWNFAVNSNEQYDGYIWLNNDSYIFPNALLELIKQSEEKQNKAIISGAFKSDVTNTVTYGGRLKGQTRNLSPDGTLQKIDWMNGNLVLVPKYVYDKIGILDKRFWHAIGDYDYGLRAIKENLEVVISKNYVGICEEHEKIEACYNKDIPMKNRFKNFYTPLGDDPFIRFVFLKRHYSLLKAIKSFTISHLFVLFPSLIKFYNNK